MSSLSVWRGTSDLFEQLKKEGKLIPNRIWFVGDGRGYSRGFGNSVSGIIYLTDNNNNVISFGSYPAEEIRMKEYANKSEFPESGKTGTLYVDKSTGRVYRWVDGFYTVLGGYSAGDGIDISDGVIRNTHTFIDMDELMDIGILD